MAKSLLWLSYDLGVRGDFESMYAFLDSQGAKECGDSFAAFWYEYEQNLLGEIEAALRAAVRFDRRSRVYVIYPAGTGKHKGKFIIGRRKSPAWAGFAARESDEEDSGE